MTDKKLKIGIVYFDDIHIIPHFITVVNELYQTKNVQVEILTYQAEHTYLYDLLNKLDIPKNVVKQLPTFWYRKISEKLKKRRISSPLYLFKKHRNKLLQDYDVLIFNDINHEYLYRHKTGNKPKFVLLMHGAGDGEYLIGKQYKSLIEMFDLVTTPGQKIKDFFDKMDLQNTQVKICGYQKFNLVGPDNSKKLFDNDKKTIVYNPHFKRELSSWYRFGNAILDYFYHSKDYNLIFAPHINLFHKKGFLKKESLNKKYFTAENILIDLGSNKSADMLYTLSADLYLGDVSSQVYEFLYKLRPAVFIDAHNTNWQDDPHYKHWYLGPVINNLDPLDELLRTSHIWHKNYIKTQQEYFDYTFDRHTSLSASERIRSAILSLFSN